MWHVIGLVPLQEILQDILQERTADALPSQEVAAAGHC